MKRYILLSSCSFLLSERAVEKSRVAYLLHSKCVCGQTYSNSQIPSIRILFKETIRIVTANLTGEVFSGFQLVARIAIGKKHSAISCFFVSELPLAGT